MVNAGRVAIVPKGEYVHGKQYKRLDSVRYLGGTYIAKKDNESKYPAYNDDNEFWMFMVGETGISDKPVIFESSDALKPDFYEDIPLIQPDSLLRTLMNGFSTAVKNIRYFSKLIGSEDISQIGDGTVTGIIKLLIRNLFVEEIVISNSIVCIKNLYCVSVQIEGANSLSASTWHTIGRIPGEICPRRAIPFFIFTNPSYSESGICQINTNGNIQVYSKTAISGVIGTITYML